MHILGPSRKNVVCHPHVLVLTAAINAILPGGASHGEGGLIAARCRREVRPVGSTLDCTLHISKMYTS
jgi:hypothetical protein